MLKVEIKSNVDKALKKVMEEVEKQLVEVPCPAKGCKGKVNVTIADARAQKTVKCPRCRQPIGLRYEK